MNPPVCKHVLVSGIVQGVGYRFFVLDLARELGIKGWVRNLPDGRVEALLAGDAEQVQRMLDAMREGPRLARVTQIEVTEREYDDRYTSFSVR